MCSFAEKNKKIRFLNNQLESKNEIIKSQLDDIDKKDAIMSIQEMDIKRLKHELDEEVYLKKCYKSRLKRCHKQNSKYHETAELAESRCSKKSLHIKILYAVLIIGSIFTWSMR